MAQKTANFKNRNELTALFNDTFNNLNRLLPDGIVRGVRRNITPLVLYEAIAIGVADLVSNSETISGAILNNLLDDQELNSLTTGATNSKAKLLQRINYVKGRLRA